MPVKDSAKALQRELDGDSSGFRRFSSVEKALAWFFEATARKHAMRSIAPSDWKDFDGDIDPAGPERAARSYASLIYCLQDDVAGDCPTGACDRGEACPKRARHRLNRQHRWLLYEIYGLERSMVYVTDELRDQDDDLDERTVQKWINQALRVIRARMRRRNLLRQGRSEP